MAAAAPAIPQKRSFNNAVPVSPTFSTPLSTSDSLINPLTSSLSNSATGAYTPSLPTNTSSIYAPSTASSSVPLASSSSFSTPPSRTSSSASATLSSVPIVFSVPLTESVTVPATITFSSSVFVTNTVILSLVREPTTSYSIVSSAPTARGNDARTVCAGHGLDSMSIGVLSTVIFSAAVGAIIWALFAFLRPKIPQLYALREWFIRPDLRPPPLGPSFWAFLFPPVPLVPNMPSDVSDLGDSDAVDARLFPSDDELSQRTIWIAFLLVLGWTFVGLTSAIPLYTMGMPCTGDTLPTPRYGGQYSALQDLSLIRLLRLLQNGNVSTTPAGNNTLSRRLVVNDIDRAHKARVRLLILTVILLAVSILPALIKLLKEFEKLLAFRRRWLHIRCQGMEMGWLSLDKTPGFVGLGESAVKDKFSKYGLGALRDDQSRTPSERDEDVGRRVGHLREVSVAGEESEALTAPGGLRSGEDGNEINVTGLFSVVDTRELDELIHARAVVLNSLEQAECLYISSFRVSTPEPTIASMDNEIAPPPGEDSHPRRRRISHPRALQSIPGRRSRHPSTFSNAPTSYTAPSSYYRLRGVRRVSTGPMGIAQSVNDAALADEFGQRIGSRAHTTHQSVAFGRLPQGPRTQIIERPSQVNLAQGPNYGPPTSAEEAEWLERRGWNMVPDRTRLPEILERSSFWSRFGLGFPPRASQIVVPPTISEESFFSPHDWDGSSAGVHQRAMETLASAAAAAGGGSSLGLTSAVHQRVQQQPPIPRPLSGLHPVHLETLYNDIRKWRTQLKKCNYDIAEKQQQLYDDIANGVSVRGWLLLGRGVRFLPGVQMIEGRSKDDVRWSELQHDGGVIGQLSFWIIVAVVSLLLAGALIPVVGLVLASGPNFAHYFPFLKPLVGYHHLGPALATTLAPSLAAILFICVGLGIVHYAAQVSGSVSNSNTRMMAFKATFFVVTFIGGVWLIALSAILFSLESLNSHSGETTTISEGAVYISAFVLVLSITAAFIAPGLLMLQPVRLWRVTWAQWKAITPRQTFRAAYPRPYNPSFGMGACILGVFFAATLTMLFPLIGPPLVVLLFLTLVAHRYLVGYVYGRTERGQSGGLLQLWIIRRFATMLALQPLLLGLILLSNRLWTLAIVLLGSAALLVIVVELYTEIRLREPGVRSLSSAVRTSLEKFTHDAKRHWDFGGDEKDLPARPHDREAFSYQRSRTSLASVLDMISLTLAIGPSASRPRRPVPLLTESIDDLVSTARAAATNPAAAPQLNPIDPMDDVADLLYPPTLLAPPPVIWLSNDAAGVAESEASDLRRFHQLDAILDLPTSPPPPPPKDVHR